MERFHLNEKVVGPHGPGEVVRVQQTGDKREYLVCYRDGRALIADGSVLKHTFRALHPGMIGGPCANCYTPSGMHGDHQACGEMGDPYVVPGTHIFTPKRAPEIVVPVGFSDEVNKLLDNISGRSQRRQ